VVKSEPPGKQQVLDLDEATHLCINCVTPAGLPSRKLLELVSEIVCMAGFRNMHVKPVSRSTATKS
jgi:hypothetical protein